MMTYWGTKTVRRRLGVMAAYCPICRAVRAFEAEVRESVDHFMYISLGNAQHLGYVRRCPDCRIELKLPEDEIDAIHPDRTMPAEKLMSLARPELHEVFRRRLEWDQKMRKGKLESEVRNELILEPFFLLEDDLRFRSKPSTNIMALDPLLVITFVLFLISVLIVTLFEGRRDDLSKNHILVIGIFFAIFIILAVTSQKRLARRVTLPWLARSLAPLRPTQREFELIYESGTASRSKITELIPMETLMQAVGRFRETDDDPLE